MRVRNKLSKVLLCALTLTLLSSLVWRSSGTQGKHLQCSSWLLAHNCMCTKGLDKLISTINYVVPGPCVILPQ